MNLDVLVQEFANSVAAQAEAIAEGDPKTGNKFARRYIAAFSKLRARGDEGRDALASLFQDPRAEVRVMAAAYLLRHCGDKARAVLTAEAEGKGLTAFGAAQALKRWEEGTWALDPA
jgi:hypothetical protein